MRRTIATAMQTLNGRPFGIEKGRGEADFENAFGDCLAQITEQDGWKWRYRTAGGQERFATDALTNEGHIDVDIVGRHPSQGAIAIELKYVPIRPPKAGSGQWSPSDKPAFPWDIAKDCLKLELLRGGKCSRVAGHSPLPNPNALQIYVLGLTNCSDYWEGDGPLSWSANFVRPMRCRPVRFERGLVRTTGTYNAVFGQERCHIAFGLNWVGDWSTYSSQTGTVSQFRYLLLNPDPDCDDEPRWDDRSGGPEEVRFGTVPLLDSESREGWRRLNLEELKRTGRS